MKVLVFLFVLVGLVFFGALGEYVTGRVILPAVGLTAPDYWTWFWFMFWVLVFSVPIRLTSKGVKEL